MTTRGIARSPSPRPWIDLADNDSGAALRLMQPNLFNQATNSPRPPILRALIQHYHPCRHVTQSGSNTSYVVQHIDEFDTPRSSVINKTCYNDAVDTKLSCSKSGTLQVYTFLVRSRPGSLEGPGGYGASIQRVRISSPAYIPPSV